MEQSQKTSPAGKCGSREGDLGREVKSFFGEGRGKFWVCCFLQGN